MIFGYSPKRRYTASPSSYMVDVPVAYELDQSLMGRKVWRDDFLVIRNRLIRIGVQDHYGFPVKDSKLRFMKTILFATVALATFAAAHEYDFLKDWPTMPEGLETIGDSHG